MEDTDSLEFSDTWQEDDQQTEYTEISADDFYEMLLSQQQQLQDIGLVLQQIMEVMQQTHRPPPDYQPLLQKIVANLVEIKQQKQQLQRSISEQKEILLAIKSEVGNTRKRLGEMISKANSQSKAIDDYLGWPATLRYVAIGLLTGISFLVSTQIFSNSANSGLEKKIDALNGRIEKILKKGR
jgi:DNA-binding transcriptional MerR regulator